MINWRLAGGFGALGLLLSLISGAIAGNPFGVVVLRSLMVCIVSVGVGAAAGYLLDRYVPELGRPQESQAVQAEDARDVDIVLEAENPHVNVESEGIIEVSDEPVEEDAVESDEEESTAEQQSAETEDKKEPLPDMGSMESSFAAGEQGEAAAPMNSSRSNPNQEFASQQDPATVAKAIQTFLKKDQEG